ncbi:cytochrome c oxidase subunit II [Aneurinibacillus danicus]|uniref:Cytochrome c oxidase subunit 2 n=1 Tax=Aneurinibacillus danicus TaxID=267746 RepID=A0A511V1W7_9BACL|nr:cytochrome c oxidase subunit II [Aneurinibacillus danicus]GEN32885.1 cytochrome c oxidase subunit 2 [Aneurinibacillus danicus]
MDFSWLFPPAINDMAKQVDSLFWFIAAISLFIFVLVEMLLFIFLVRYRRKRPDKQGIALHGNTKMEIIWTVIPALILVAIGVFGSQMTYAIQTPPKDVYTINVTGYKWRWDFEYPEGFKTTNKLVIPEDKNVLFKITSADIIHSFWIPAMRIKQDAVPGRQTQIWSGPTKQGEYPIVCAEYCGTMHSMMLAKLNVVNTDEFNKFVQSGGKAGGGAAGGPGGEGQALAEQKGCLSCHATDQNKLVGPGWGGMFGKDVKLSDGSTAKYDEKYIVESIMDPAAKIPQGYSSPMPPQQVTEEEAKAIAEYIETLK